MTVEPLRVLDEERTSDSVAPTSSRPQS